jgi:hypothetical protein
MTVIAGPSALHLSGETARAIESTLRSSCLDALASLLWRLRRKLSVEPAPREAREVREAIDRACELALAESLPHGDLRITPLGAKIAACSMSTRCAASASSRSGAEQA